MIARTKKNHKNLLTARYGEPATLEELFYMVRSTIENQSDTDPFIRL